MNPVYFCYCSDCGAEVKVAPGTFKRVMRGDSVMVCDQCTATATYCRYRSDVTHPELELDPESRSQGSAKGRTEVSP